MVARLPGDRAAALDLLASIFFVLLSFLVFAPELVLGLKIVDGDLYRQVVPVTAWYGATVREGGDFLWSPGLLGGFPLAFSQYGFFFPLDWILARVLDPDRAVALNLALHLPLAGIATYFYGRSIGLSRFPALLAGVGYQLSTESVALGIGGYLLRSLFLLPTLLLCVELVARRSVRWALLAAGAVGVSLLSGTAYIVAIAALNAGLYTVARGIWLWRKGLRERAPLLLGSMGGAVLLGTGLAAIRVLPTLVVTAQSVRSGGLPFDNAAGGSVHIGPLLAAYLLPLTRLEGVGGGDVPSYVGPVVLALAVMAILKGKRDFFMGVFTGLLLFNALTSLGSNAPLFGLLHQMPLLAYFRTASRFSVFSAFFLSLLAARSVGRDWDLAKWGPRSRSALKATACLTTAVFGLALLVGVLWMHGGDAGIAIRNFAEGNGLGPLNPLRPRILLALAAIPATMWLLYARMQGRLSKTIFQVCSVCGTALLLLIVGVAMMQFRIPDSAPPATARYLQEDKSLFRTMSYWPTTAYFLYLGYLAQDDPGRISPYSPEAQDFRYRYMRETLAPNFPLQYGLESIDGYEVLQSTRQAIAMKYFGSQKAEDLNPDPKALPGTQELARKLEDVGAKGIMDRIRVFQAFNVKYVLTNLELWQHSDKLRVAFTSPIPMLDPRMMTNVYVYQVIGAMPRAYLVPDSMVVKGETEALDGIMSGQLDPSRAVALEGEAPLPSGPRLDPGRSNVQVVSYGDSQVDLSVQASGSGFLVLNDAYYPGWSAWVDGRETPVLVANGWVRAVAIPSGGEHKVRFAYVPPLYPVGRLVSLGSLLLILTGTMVGISRGRSKLES